MRKDFNFSAGIEEEMFATMPSTENDDEDEIEMVRGRRKSSAQSDHVSFKSSTAAARTMTFNFSDDGIS